MRVGIFIASVFCYHLSCAQSMVWDTTFSHYQDIHASHLTHFKEENTAQIIRGYDTTTVLQVSSVELRDVSDDGYVDIRFNIDSTETKPRLFFWDSILEQYTEVIDYSTIAGCTQLDDEPEYFYSILSLGCDEKDWQSHLFKIENFQIEKVATMLGVGCNQNNSEYWTNLTISPSIRPDSVVVSARFLTNPTFDFEAPKYRKYSVIYDHWLQYVWLEK